jgi:chromosome segregation ATPase
MDTQLTTVAERAAQIRTQVAGLVAQKQKTEGKLGDEHAGIRRAALKRASLVETLIDANETVARKAHREIDELDGAIRNGERVAEGLQGALAKTVQEIQALHVELAEAERVIRAQERERALEAFQIKLKRAAHRAGESLDSARADLAALVILETKAVLAANGDAAHEGNIHRICEPIFEDFTRQQANMDSRGWRLFVGHRNLQFYIRPMTRG